MATMSCKIWEPVGIDEISTTIRAGDTVRVQTENDREIVFEVEAVDGSTIEGEDHHIPVSYITRTERQRLGVVRTFFLSLGIGSVGFIVFGLLAAAALAGGF